MKTVRRATRRYPNGRVSMLPEEDVQLEVDPDPELEREAEETAQRVMSGGKLGIQKLSDTEVHVQRSVRGRLSSALDMISGVGADKTSLNTQSLGDASGMNERLNALAENQREIATRVEELSVAVEGGIFEKMGNAGTGEAIKMGATELGKESPVPFGGVLGALSGAALQAIYNNREQVLEILDLKSTVNTDSGDKRITGNNPMDSNN